MQLHSKIDHSINWVIEANTGGTLECRFVHRPGTDYFIAYVSSHTGCNKACRMCWLTQTGQTQMQDASFADIFKQIITVFDYAKTNFPAVQKAHINFMARGEPFANQSIANSKRFDRFVRMVTLAFDYLEIDVIISTIYPEGFQEITYTHPAIRVYYSMYSADIRFRHRWLPNAQPSVVALRRLKAWQETTGNTVKIHFPLIAGENDGPDHLDHTLRTIEGIFGHDGIAINLIRYNPPNNKSFESEDYDSAFLQICERFPRSTIIPRVGEDVYASCGMFISPGETQ